MLHPWVAFLAMPLFAFANAGVTLSLDELDGGVMIAVLVAFAVGKPIGIVAFAWLSVRTGIALRRPELTWSLLSGAGLLAGIGFTMALFIAGLSFGPDLLDSAKLGIFLASIVAGFAGISLLFLATSDTAGQHRRS